MNSAMICKPLLIASIGLAALSPSSAETPPDFSLSTRITAGESDQTIVFKASSLSASLFALAIQGKLAFEWDRKELLFLRFDGFGRMECSLPGRLRRTGLYEIALWDTDAGRALPFHSWVPVEIEKQSDVAAADVPLDKITFFSRGYEQSLDTHQISTGALLDRVVLKSTETVQALAPDRRYAWILDTLSSTVRRIDLETHRADQEFQDPSLRTFSDRVGVALDSRAFFATSYPVPTLFVDGKNMGAVPELPISRDERGRLIFGLQACDFNYTDGVTKCANLFPSGTLLRAAAVVKGRILTTDGSVIDEATGALIRRLSGRYSNGIYLAHSNMILVNGQLLDADSFELAGSLEIACGPVWEPGWCLAASGPGTIVAQPPQLRGRPEIRGDGIVNGATGLPGAIAPGEIISIFGSKLGPTRAVGPMPIDGLQLSGAVYGVEVLVDGRRAPILYSGLNQINCVVPELDGLAPAVTLQVVYAGMYSARTEIPSGSAAPGLFTYKVGDRIYASALTSDGTVQGPGNPVSRGDFAVLYATGVGVPVGLSPSSIAARGAPLPEMPVVTVAGKQARILYAGAAPGLTAGFTQINVEVPNDAPTGDSVEVRLSLLGRTSPVAYLVVR